MPNVPHVEGEDRRCASRREDELHLKIIGLVQFNNGPNVTATKPVRADVALQHNNIEDLVVHGSAPGNAVTNRGASSLFRTIQRATKVASLPPGPVMAPSTRYFCP